MKEKEKKNRETVQGYINHSESFVHVQVSTTCTILATLSPYQACAILAKYSECSRIKAQTALYMQYYTYTVVFHI